MSEEVRKIVEDDQKLTAETAAVFADYDTDNSGFIDAKELGNALRTIAEVNFFDPPTEDQIQQKYKATDVNGDGKISREEFKAFVKQLLTDLYL